MDADQLRQHLDYPSGADATRDIDRQTLAAEFVEYCQALELLAVGTGVKHEVVGSDMADLSRWQWPGPARGNPPSGTPARHLQAGLAPQPMGPIRSLRRWRNGGAFLISEVWSRIESGIGDVPISRLGE
jgi:hypothetical protein